MKYINRFMMDLKSEVFSRTFDKVWHDVVIYKLK